MNADMAFAIGFLAGWMTLCVFRILGALDARIERQANQPTVAPKSETGIPRPKIIPPQGGSGTAPPKVGPKGGTGTPPPAYPRPVDPRKMPLSARYD